MTFYVLVYIPWKRKFTMNLPILWIRIAKSLIKKINLLFGSTLSDHAETIMLTNKVDHMPSLMDLILKEHEESFTKTLCDTLKPIFGQLTDVYKDFCGSQRKTLKTISAEMISLAKQFESNIVTSYKDATSRLKDLSEGLDPLQLFSFPFSDSYHHGMPMRDWVICLITHISDCFRS